MKISNIIKSKGESVVTIGIQANLNSSAGFREVRGERCGRSGYLEGTAETSHFEVKP